ncbi:MAG TPA: hypothetical protein VKZ65_15985, partial [Glycomyces sp.]|nr:hypothetical protein [Glycomyces sp.]
MVQSTKNTSRKIWRTVLTGAAVVPIAVLAAAPAVGAATTGAIETADVEQQPPAPAPDPDQALLDLQTCLTKLEGVVAAPAPAAPAPAVGAAEQQPAPPTPDLATLVETCEAILASAQGTA